MRASWQIGDHIEGRWEIYKILQGGAGVVYIVYDRAFNEPFAAKTFQDEIFACSPDVADRFMREALAWIKMDVHPNVAQARMLEKIEGKPFLFLEYVSGGDLGSWIGTPRLLQDLPQVLRFAIQFCDGMIHALSKGIRAHRDIKPRNCLISHDGVLKVTDFGLVQLAEETALAPAGKSVTGRFVDASLTKTSVGTCTHMAPEQFGALGPVDPRVDIYSFGVMLFQMVKGELPFLGQSWQELEQMHKTQKPEYVSGTNRALADLIQACLAKDPRSRPSSFKQVREVLAGIYRNVAGAPPAEPARGAELTSAQLINKGSSLDNLGKRDEAIACFDAALKLDPLSARAWFNKGVALFASRRPNEALACYEKALQMDAKSAPAWSNLGVALKSAGKMKDAIACYDRAIQYNPRYPNAWVNKGVALKASGKTDEALSCYEHALKLNPSDVTTWANKGNVLCMLGRAEEAVTCFDRALALDSSLALTWLNRGIALSSLKRFDEALHSYSTVLELNPQDEQAWFLSGMTMMNAFQQYREAVPYLEEAERLGVKEAKEALAFCMRVIA